MVDKEFKGIWRAQDGFTFTYKNRILWKIKLGWMLADVVDNNYQNHRSLPELEMALMELIR